MGESAQAEQAVAEFDRDIAVSRVDETTYAAELSGGWVVGGGINGGFLLAVIANALREHLPNHPDSIVMSSFYASASTPGPARIRVETKRDKGSLAIATAELWQGEELRITATATYADLDGLHAKSSDFEQVTVPAPELPPIEECLSSVDAPEQVKEFVPMLDRYEIYMPKEQYVWGGVKPTGEAVFSGWFRHHDREPDPISLLQVLDTLPPATFGLDLPGWAPTLELTCHIRHKPAPGWLKVTHYSRNLSGGMFEEDCEIWDSEGKLVAQGRQLARLPRP